MSDRQAREVWVHRGTTWIKESELEAIEAKLEAARHLLASAPRSFVPTDEWSRKVDEWLGIAAQEEQEE